MVTKRFLSICHYNILLADSVIFLLVFYRQNLQQIFSKSVPDAVFYPYSYASFIIRIESSLNKLKVHMGTNHLNEEGAVYDIESVSINQDYDNISNINDVALIHLTTPIAYSTLVKPINLLTTDKNLEGKPCILTGWGRTQVSNS